MGSIIGGVTGGLLSVFMGEDIFEGIKGGAKFGAIIGGFGGLGGAVGSYFGCGSTFVNICCKISRVSGKIAGGMFGFDIASMIGYKLGGEDNPIYQLNMACHSNDVYNYFQFGTNIVAAFTGGVTSNKTCFIAGTLIVTEYGLSKIDSIKPGDLVLSTNVDTMETGFKKVFEKYVRKTRELVHIVVGGEKIVSTADHPYFVVGRGFINAGHLCIGSPLQNQDGKILEVEQIYKEYLEEDEEVTVYNFQVEDWHTYHVGEMEVLVHNAGPKYGESGIDSNNWQRNLQNIDELDIELFKNLKNNGTVKVNSSGSNRPLYSEPNSFYSTANGEHVFVYDENGKLIYDLSSQRVKGFKINTNPAGKEFFQDYKLKPVGEIPDGLKEIFGW